MIKDAIYEILKQPVHVILTIFFIIGVILAFKSIKNQKQRLQNYAEENNDKLKYQIDYLTNDEELVLERNKRARGNKMFIIFSILGFATMFISLGFGFVILILGFFISLKNSGNYTKVFKSKVIQQKLLEYDSSLIYNPLGEIPESIYYMAKFEKFDTYISEDEIQGTIEGNKFILADVCTQEYDKNSETYDTKFRGQVAIVELPTSLGFNLSIVKNSNEKDIFSKEKRIISDNSNFEDFYDVFSTDDLKTMKILTPAVTTRILEMSKQHGFDFELKLIDNYIFFRFHAINLFEPNVNNPAVEAAKIKLYIEILDSIKSIMHELIEVIKKA